jgi:hypothetical protein
MAKGREGPRLVAASSKGRSKNNLDQPPLLYHLPDFDLHSVAKPFFDAYASMLREDVRSSFFRMRLVDAALKVVGVGSVGTRCPVVLMLGEQNEPIFIQIQEARDSVLAGEGQRPRVRNPPVPAVPSSFRERL